MDNVKPGKKYMSIKYKPATLEVEKISTLSIKWSCIDLRVMHRKKDSTPCKDIRFCLKSEKPLDETEFTLNHSCIIKKVSGKKKTLIFYLL